MREVSEEYTELAAQVVGEHEDLDYIVMSNVEYCVMTSDQAKKKSMKTVFGECEKVPEKYSYFIPFDFIITIYEPNVEGFSEEQLKILLWHELRHIGVDPENPDMFYTVPHDIEDFEDIIRQHGLHWAR